MNDSFTKRYFKAEDLTSGKPYSLLKNQNFRQWEQQTGFGNYQDINKKHMRFEHLKSKIKIEVKKDNLGNIEVRIHNPSPINCRPILRELAEALEIKNGFSVRRRFVRPSIK